MIPFFRQIRKKLADNNQFLKYSRYAIGEILLIVIGILIAVQINDWNDQRIKRKLELEFLVELNDNLMKDTARIQEVLNFNQKKEGTIGSMLQGFERSDSELFNLKEFSDQMSVLGSYDYFMPNRIAFDNLLDTESIGLISNKKLRTHITKYYKFDYSEGTQKTVQIRTRNFNDISSKHLTTKENLNGMFGVNLDLKSNNETQIYKDEEVISAMVAMSVVMFYQNGLLASTSNDVQQILELLKDELHRKE